MNMTNNEFNKERNRIEQITDEQYKNELETKLNDSLQNFISETVQICGLYCPPNKQPPTFMNELIMNIIYNITNTILQSNDKYYSNMEKKP